MKRLKTFAAAVAIAALGGALTPAIHAYTTYGEWGTLAVSFHVNPVNADVSSNAAISALQGGMETWNTQSGTGFRFTYAGQTSTTATGYDNKNVILFRNESKGSTIASTYSWSSNGVLVDSDIVFWDGGYTFFTGSSGCSSGAYIEDIAAHELGHAMGLQHSTATDATMYGNYPRCSQALRTLAADDIAGAKKLYADGAGTADAPPTVKILSPANGASVTGGTSVTFSGSASDAKDGDISSKIAWKSNVAGSLGTGASISKTLTAGSHTVTATVTDSIGFTSATAIIVTVGSGSTNTAPAVTITSPANGATLTAGASTSFTGTASDTQDGNISSRLVWRSSIDGQIGTGASFTKALSAGSHTITATASDSAGLTTQRGIIVTVAAAQAPLPTEGTATPTLTVSGYKDKGMQRANLSWKGLTGSSVDIYRDNAKVATTMNDGVYIDAINAKGAGSYTYKVCVTGSTVCTSTASVSF